MAKLKRFSMRLQIYDIIKEKILTQELDFAEAINIVSLSTELSVSNTPIREALSLLESEGLVTSSMNSKYRVIDLTEELNMEISQTICILLMGSYDVCVDKNLSQTLYLLMEEALAEQKKALAEKKYFEFIEKAIQFDRMFIEVIKSPRLDALFNSVANILFLAVRYNHQIAKPNRKENIKEHEAIMLAIKEKRHDEVKRLLRMHYNKHISLTPKKVLQA